MKLAKRIGRIGFIVGFLGPVIFIQPPASFFTYESHVLSPLCPYIDGIMTRSGWVQVGLTLGLIFGILYGLIGFTIGFAVSRARQSK